MWQVTRKEFRRYEGLLSHENIASSPQLHQLYVSVAYVPFSAFIFGLGITDVVDFRGRHFFFRNASDGTGSCLSSSAIVFL